MKTDKQPHTVGRAVNTVTLWLVVGLVLAGLCAPTGVQASVGGPAGPEAPATSHEPSFPLQIPQMAAPIGFAEMDTAAELQAAVTMEMIPNTGTADRTSVYNGDTVTYTLVLTNESAVPITYFTLYDLLPQDTLDNITCVSTAPVCELIVEQEVFPEPSGGTVVVTATRQIKWEVLTPLAPQERFTVAFSGRLMGQPEGARFTNRAFVRYWLQGATQPGTASVELSLTAHVRITPGTTSISTVPTWFSNDMGGTLSQDWGDFDRDGDLDLALGSSLGTAIYRNDGGVLQQIMDFIPDAQGQQRLSYGVRWADLIPEAAHTLELVVVGDSADHTANSEGINYIYQFDSAQQSFSTSEVFTTDLQLVRVAPGDYDGDGDIDLVASTNAINAPCTVALYRNDGTGHFTGTVTAAGPNQIECLSQAATAALGPGDYDNDGDLDLALGAFPSTLQLLVNERNGAVLTATNPLVTLKTIESGLEYIPYDLVWGDYNGDGYLDLAAAYPLQRETQVYQNQPSSGTLIATAESIRTSTFMTPLTVDWGDFNGDGRLDLAVADSRLKFYEYSSSTQAFSLISSLVPPLTTGQVWSIQGVELNEQHTLNLAMTNRDGPSRIFSIVGPKLRPTSVPLGSGTFGQVLGSSVAWGDVDNDGDLDLLVGADALGVSSYLYLNQQGRFNTRVEIRASGFGPHAVAWGDVTGDGRLDMAIGTPSEVHIYFNGNTAGEPNQRFRMGHPAASVAWGDADDDGRLDLLVGQNGGPVTLYLNRGTQLSTTAIFTTSEIGQITSVAWGDYDQDYYMDFAVGAADQPLRVYRNNGDGRTFRLAWSSPAVVPALSLDWADYDRDGDLDLAVAGSWQVMVWENQGTTFGTAPVWQATLAASSVAWGDWDNDGYPDLAAGGTFSPTSVVYANLGSAPGVPQLAELWYGSSNLPVAGLAWGDMEGDGDLDLAVASAGSVGRTSAMADEAGPLPQSYAVRQTTAALALEPSGVYTNILATPAHLYYPANSLTPLANTPPYVRVARPGTTGAAYFYSAAPVLTGPNHPTVTIQYQVYDHEADPLARTYFEYSLDGGSVWKTAIAATSTVILTRTATTGATGTFIWNAAADRAISDNARFRVRVVPNNTVGPVQRAVGIGVSPPFRVRSVDCVWPSGASIVFTPTTVVTAGQQIEFTGRVLLAEGFITYEWDFGDGTTGSGRVIKHSYGRGGTYTVTLAVHGPDCPPSVPSRPAYAFTVVTIPRGGRLYLPLVLRNRSTALVVQSELPEIFSPVTLAAPPATTPVAVRFSVPQLQATTASAGSNLLRITTSAQGFSHQPAINGAGNRLAFWSTARTARNPDGSIEIFLADVQPNGTLSYTQLTSSTGSILVGFNLGPSIDEAGERVVFFSDRDLTGQNSDRNFEIFLADIGAGGIFTLTQLTITPKGINILPEISGNGRFVAFASDRNLTGSGGQVDGQTEIYRAEPLSGGGTTFTRITTAPANYPGSSDEPTISADGKRIAFTSEQDLTGENADGNREIFLAEVLPGGAITYTQITHSNLGVNEQPSLSGDGRWLAFISDRDLVAGQNTAHIRQVFMAELGTDPHSVSLSQLTTSSGAKSRPTISADGLRLAYLLNQQVQLYDAVEQTTLSGGTGADNAYPSLSAGGDAVAFADSGQIYLRRYPLADLAVTKSGMPTTVAVGELVTYTLVVTNYGPSPATDVLLSDTLPAGFVSRLASGSPDAYTDKDGTPNGFGGGVHSGTYWNTVSQTVQLNPTASSALMLLHLDESAGATTFNDASGAGNPAACAGTTCPQAVAGQFGNAAQLDGSNDQLIINSAPALAYRSFTVAFWARRLSTGTADVVVGQGAPTTNVGLYIGFRSNNRFTCAFWGNDLDTSASYFDTLWHHWACTYDVATRRRTLYRDGVLVAQDTATAYYQGGGPLVVGNFPGLTDYFHGQLDEVAIFTRVLTATEVQLLMGTPVMPYSGYFDSRVLTDTLGSGRWSTLGWTPYRPLGESLPDDGIQETGYVTGNVNMNGTVLLLHLDELSGANAFQDTSGRSNNTYCLGTTCPTAGAPGAFATALEFDGAVDYLYAPDNSTLDLNQFTVGLWVWPVTVTPGLYQTLLVKEDSYGYNVNYSLMLAKGSTQVNYDFLPAGQCGNIDAFVGGNGTQALQLNAWNHVMMTYDGTDLIGYVNGQQDIIFPGVRAPCQNSFPLKLGREFSDNVQTPFQGRLDEIVILNRPLSAAEVRDHYLRGLARLRFQVRACPTPACTNIAFVGPDGTSNSFYTSLNDALTGPPELGLQNLAAGRYAQYRFALDVDAYPREFGVSRVTLRPSVTCQGQKTVTCTLGSATAPLAVGQALSLTLPAQIVDGYAAYLAAAEVGGQRVVTNTVTVDAEESDHGPAGNNDASAHTGLDFSILLGVTISGRDVAAVDTPEVFTATVNPLNATPPISYTWSATGKPTAVYTSGQVSYVLTYTWSTPGVRVITVTADNPLHTVVTDVHTVTVVYKVDRLRLTASSPMELEEFTILTATVAPTSTNVTYLWDFGDGHTATSGPGTSTTITHTYAQTGTYTVVVTATNLYNSLIQTATVEVLEAPIRNLELQSNSPVPLGTSAAVTATLTTGTNVTYTWDFGDGTPLVEVTPYYLAKTVPLTHTYVQTGTYTVVVTATNSVGSEVVTTSVQVVDVPIQGLVVLNNSPTEYDDPTVLTATVAAGTNVHYTWAFGDGQLTTIQTLTFTNRVSLTHVFSTYVPLRLYTVVVTATNGTNSVTATTVVTVYRTCWAQLNGADYPTVQAAIEVAVSGATVKVAGTCSRLNTSGGQSQVAYLDKSLTLQGGYTYTQWTVADPIANPTTLDAHGQGRGLFITGGNAVTVSGLRLTRGYADYGGGLYALNATLTLSACQLFGNQATVSGGGLWLEGGTGTLRYSQVTTNTAVEGGGLYIKSNPAMVDSLIIRGNSAGMQGGGLYLFASNAIVINTVLADNQAPTQGSGVSIYNSSPRFLHTTLARNSGNNGFYYNGAGSQVYLTNTILVSHTTGVVVNAGSALLNGVLWAGNGTNTTGAVTVNNAVTGPPAFLADGYHIGLDSAARNRGSRTSVTLDIDGDLRDRTPDLGADELRTCWVRLNNNPTDYADVQAAVDAATQPTDEVKVAGLCASLEVRAGVTQTVYLSRTLLLQGGYTLTNWTTPDPVAHPTTLDALGGGRALYITGAISPTISGLHLVNGYARQGGGAYVLTAAPVFSQTWLEGNEATVAGGGLFLNGAGLTLTATTVFANQAAHGGGLYLQTAQPPAALSGAVFRLPLDEPVGATTFADAVGGDNPAVCSGATCPLAEVLGAFGTGLQFNGAQSITIADAPALRVSQFSLSLWFYWDDLNTANAQCLINKRDQHFALFTGGSAGVNGLRFIPAGAAVLEVPDVILPGWNHLVATYDGSAAYLYRNGVLVGSLTGIWGDDLTADSYPFLLGQRQGDTYYFRGALDEVHFYNRALSAAEVAALAAPALTSGAIRLSGNTLLSNTASGNGGGLYLRLGWQTLLTGNQVLSNSAALGGGLFLDTPGLPGSLLHLPLDEPARTDTWADLSGHGYHATCSGTACPQPARSGPVRYAAAFERDDYLLSAALPLSNTSFTLAAWARRGSTGEQDFFMGQGNAAQNQGLHFGFRSGSDGNLFTCAFYANDLNSPAPETDLLWHHWVCTYDALTHQRQLYKDGQVVISDTSPVDYQGSGPLWIGRSSWSSSGFQGLLDEVQIYGRALSAAEVQRLYRLTQPPAVQLEGTTLAANRAITGGGLAVRGGAAAIVGNLLRENSAALVNGGYGGGFWLERSGTLLEANTLTANQSHRGGGGALLLNSPAILRSNWVLTNTALQDGGGFYLQDSVASLLSNRVLDNRAAGPGSGWGGGLYLYQSNAQLKNNVLMGNVAAMDGGGVFVDSSAAQFWHTTLVSNTNTGIWMQDAAVPLALTNTLVVSHVTGVRGGSPAGMTMDGVLWFGNTLDASGAVGVNHATTGAPAFAADGYHITHGSAARDAGITGLNYDLDGDPRPVGAGYDLGADEIRTCFAKLNDAPTLYEEVQLAVDASTHVTDVVKLAGYCRGVSVRDGLTQTIYLSKTLTLQGGWDRDFAVRDPALYPTTLDADGNRRVVYITGNVTPTLLDLRLTGGNATGLGGDPGGADSGGGIYVVTATATISGCHVYGNQAVYGGGIFLLRSNARLIGNTVTANRADRFGGGIEIDYGDLAQLSRNTVVSNSVGSALCGPQFCGGGGIYVYVTAPITLTDTIIASNTTQVEGGGLYLDTSVVTARNTVLRHNQADSGGGLMVYSTTAWMTNTLIADNRATNHTSGLKAQAASLTMYHTTLAHNTGGDGNGVYVMDDGGRPGVVTLTNTILVSQSVGIEALTGNMATLQGVLWFGNGTNVGGGTINVTQALTGTPAFVDPAAGDYRLQGFSMARDAGVAGPADTDLDGNPRPQGKAPDLGAYEFQAALTLAKRQNPTAVQAGGLLTYTLTYTATGTRPSLGVLLSDTTPAHMTFVAAIPTPASAPGVGASGPVVWSLGDLTPLATGAVTLVVQVNSPLTRGLVLTNSALLTDTQGLAETAALTKAVQTSHALTLTQWASTSPAPAGEPLTYTLAYTITGNEPVFGAVMSNTLPAYTTFITATGGLGLLSTDPVRWALGDFLPPESGQTQATGMLTLVVQVGPAPNGAWLTHTAILSDTSGQSATRTITTSIQSAHTLSVTKSASSAVVQAGDRLTYTIAYTVTGTEPALNPRLADTLPAQVTLVSCTGAPCGAVGRTVTWTVGTLTPTAPGLVTAVVQVPSLLNGTVLTNAVTFTDTLGGNATHNITTLVQSSHSLSVTKLGPLTCTPGTLITYTLLYTVTGNEPARGVILSDTLPANTTYVGCSGGLSCSRSGTLVTWTLGTLTPTLAAPASGTARLTVTVASPLDNGILITNSVALTDTTGLSATDTITGEVTSQPLLQLLKTSLNAGGPPLIPGERLTYTLRITNTGTARADVTITDTVPTFTDYVVGSISGGDSRSVNLPVLNWTLNNLNSGAAAQLSFAVVVTTPLTHATAIYNLATATGVNGTGSHQVSVAAQDDLTDTVTAGHTLTLTKSASPSVAQPGALLTYTIAYTVTGTEPVYGVVVSDTTPVSTTYFSATPAPTSAPGVGSSGTVRWQQGNLLPPASGQTQATGVLTWVVQVANLPPAGIPLTNTVIITDASGQSATRVITTALQGSHTLTVTKRSAPALIYPGDLVTYTLVYTVTGNESAPGVVVSDTVPANATYQSCAGGLTCSGPAVGSGGLVTWNLGNVVPGSGAVTLTVQVVASPAGVALTNTVFISDTSGLSGTYRLTTTLQSRHTLWLAKQGPALVGAGNLLTYTLAYSVTGNENAISARLSDTVPLNTLYESCAGGTSCAQVSGLVTWSLGTLTPPSAGVVTLTVRAATPLISGTQILNTAFISDTNAGITAAAQATTLVTATHSLALTKQGAATVNAGAWLTYTLLYTVTGNEPASGAVISDTVPANTIYQSCAPAGCTESGGVVRWNLGTLNPASGRVTLTVQTTVPLANGTVLTNVSAFTDTGGLSVGAQVTTTVISSHALVVRKAVAPATVQPGGLLTYTIAYTVTGTEVAPGVTLSDTLPVSTTDPICTPACTITGNGVMTTVTWSLGTLTPVASGLVTLTVLVDTTVPSGTILANTVSITDTTGAAGSDTVNTLVQIGSTRARRILGLELPPPRYGVVERQRWGRAR